MPVSRFFRHLLIDLGLFLFVGIFLAVNAGWTPSRILGQLSNVCTDSDGFANIRAWGQAQGEGVTLTDYCRDSKTNMEAYCTISGPAYTQITCPGNCNRGVCNVSSFSSRSYSWSSVSFSEVSSSESSSQSSSSRSFASLPPMSFCTDSDAGLNYDTVGHVTEEMNGNRTVTWDQCRDAQTLAETYCDSSGITAIQEHGCPQGCDAGKCRRASSNNSIPTFSLASSAYSSLQYSSYPLSSSSDSPSSSFPYSYASSSPLSCADMTMVIYMDVSGSMAGSNKSAAVKNGVKSVMGMAQLSKVAVVYFSDYASKRAFALPDELSAAKSWIDSLRIGGNTNYTAALKAAELPAGAAGIFLSDGMPTAGGERKEILDYIKTHIGGTLYTVAIDVPAGSSAERLLRDMAAATGGNYTRVEDIESLREVIMKQVGDICGISSSYSSQFSFQSFGSFSSSSFGFSSSLTSSACTDSDGGIDYSRRGKVVWKDGEAWDSCIDGQTIVERYCADTEPMTIIARCDGRCTDGACF